MMQPERNRTDERTRGRRGFTLIELLVAAMIAVFILGSAAFTLNRIGQAKDSSKMRLNAAMRADTAMNEIRRDLTSILRDGDLFWTRILIMDDEASSPLGDVDDDELLIFTSQARSIRTVDFSGEGVEYEAAYRIEEDEQGPVLWRRRDAMPDEWDRGGGLATPLIEGVISFNVRAFDGLDWYDEWDSDERGLPWAIEVTIEASGHRDSFDLETAPTIVLRTVTPLDRVAQPDEIVAALLADEDELWAEENPELAAAGPLPGTPGAAGAGGAGGGLGNVGGPSGPGTQGPQGGPGGRGGGGRGGAGGPTGPSGGGGGGRPGGGGGGPDVGNQRNNGGGDS